MPATHPLSRFVFESELITIGQFRCPSRHQAWREENCIGDHPLIVFPRIPVLIHQTSDREVVADPNCVMYYNSRQLYRRGLLHARGDACEFIRIAPAVLTEIVRDFDSSVPDHPTTPFPFVNGPSDSECYLRQRMVFDRVTGIDESDPLWVQETMFGVVRRVLAQAFGIRGRRNGGGRRVDTQRAHRDIAESAKTYLSTHMDSGIGLEDVSRSVHVSPFHLCRVFRRQTGVTLHQYLSQLRLRTALEWLADDRRDLTEIALRLGYSSHAHFSTDFSRQFRSPPSQYRRSRRSA